MEVVESPIRVRKYEQFKEVLKQHIREGRYKAGDRLPSEGDLARQLAVSRHALLKGLAELSVEGWIERQQGRGTFVTHRPGRRAVGEGVVAMICSDRDDGIISRILCGISKSLRQTQRELLLLDSAHDPEREQLLLDSLDERGVCGVILYSIKPVMSRNRIASLVQRGFPIVMIDRGVEGVPVPLVAVDHECGAYEVTAHLISLGHTRIAHVTFNADGGTGVTVMQAREAGYRRALAEHGIACDESLIQRVDPALMRLAHEPAVRGMLAYEQAHGLLSRADRPTAIFMLNDIFAASVYRAARNQGMRVPDDVAMAGFNNDPEAWQLPVPMTSYDQSAEEIGFRAAELLETMVASGIVSPAGINVVGKLIVRHSTDPSVMA